MSQSQFVCANGCEDDWCDGCNECHTCGGREKKLRKEIQESMIITPRTQKLQGIRALAVFSSPFQPWTVPIKHVIQSAKDIEIFSKYFNVSNGFFARPCPVTPRHGFVDSRVVKSVEELQQVWDETIAADPQGEVILMSVLNATHNAVWTPGMLTVGSGNDGATAGKNAVSFPLVPREGTIPKAVLTSARIPSKEWPYVEAVWEKNCEATYGSNNVMGYPRLTQLRAGPALESISPDWIPVDGVVTDILTPKGEDLLKWEQRILSAGSGTVVYNPTGALTDHYNVHARTMRIPIFSSRKPTIGDTYSKNIGEEQPYDPSAFLLGVAKAETFPVPNLKITADLAALMILSLHNAPVLRGVYSEWLGVGVGLMLRLGSAALQGEARHYKSHVLGSSGNKYSRESIYKRAFSQTLTRQRAKVVTLHNLFRYGAWGGSVGGTSWAKCALSLIPLYNAVGEVAREMSAESVEGLIRHFNIALNQAHNNGWWMNKFCQKDVFDAMGIGGLIAALCPSRAIHEVGTYSYPSDSISRRTSRYASWLPLIPRAPRVLSAMLVEGPSLTGGTIVIRPKLARIPMCKQIVLTPQSLMTLFGKDPSTNGSLKISYTDQGRMSLIYTHTGATLWEEEALTLSPQE